MIHGLKTNSQEVDGIGLGAFMIILAKFIIDLK